MDILEGLNPEQKKAVECVDGPMLIVAGAGSGKTRVLTSRIAFLIENGISPDSILALTFTKKAAGEMKDRIGLMVGDYRARRIWMGTFHSVFIRFLREFNDVIGFPRTFTIYDTTDSVSCIKTCLKQLNLDDKVYKPKEVLSRISKAKNDLITPTPYMSGAGGYKDEDIRHKKPDIFRIYKLYCEQCQKAGVMDFDDILLYMNILLKRSPEALQSIAGRFSHILVDEYQDTNLAQYHILRKLAAGHGNLCVVGDDSQSIYGFRGAQIQNILSFQKDFPSARIFRLERNYRSTRTIVDAANALIAHNQGRIPKNCVSMGDQGEKIHVVRAFTEQEEAMQIASAIIARIRTDSAKYEDFAVLYRTNSQSRALEEQLRRRNVPYMVYSGNSFFERAEVKDLMAYFKLAVNPSDDESFRRIVNKPARGIGDTSVAALSLAAQENGCSLMSAIGLQNLEQYGLRSAAVGKLRSFASMMEKAAAQVFSADAYDLAVSLAQESGLYLFYKADNSVEGQSRFSNVEELLNSVKLFVEDASAEDEFFVADKRADAPQNSPSADAMPSMHSVDAAPAEEDTPFVANERADAPQGVPSSASSLVRTLGDYLENVSLLSNVDVADDETNNKVALMTVHTAKGLEFPYVFVAGMEENLFPSGGWMVSPQELEEERRLFYVAITRAKKVVSVSYADTRMRNGKHESNSPSRFLRELAPQYLDHPLRREDFERPASFDEDFSGFRWKGDGRSKPAMTQPRSVTPAASRSVTPGNDRVSPVKPPVIDENFIPEPMSSFKAGETVEHNRFGRGKILEITGEVPDLKAKIAFDKYGEKLLLLKFAKLRHA